MDGGKQKLRVVFDASRQTCGGLSLNEVLRTGPRLQLSLPAVLTRWRRYHFVISADIKMMYRQIRVYSEDIDIQWRRSEEDQETHFRLETVTYGTACAPYLAIRTPHQLAQDEGLAGLRAAEVLQREIYVDDIFTGADSLEDVCDLQKELSMMLIKGDFELRKWTSNHLTVLKDLPAENCLRPLGHRLMKEEPVRTLGVFSNPVADEFRFRSPPLSGHRTTKRTVFGLIARLFDPVGWLSPIFIQAKIFMHHIWLACLDWDDDLPPSLLSM